jgi:hypothetical protein
MVCRVGAWLVVALLLCSACGGEKSTPRAASSARSTAPATRAAAPPAIRVAPGPLSAAEVIRVFAATTGIHLQVLVSNSSWQELIPTGTDMGNAVADFGPFALYLVRPGKHVGPGQMFGGKHGRRASDGMVWFPPDAEAYWFAAKQYRNLWVQWKGGIHPVINPDWTKLDKGLSPLA